MSRFDDLITGSVNLFFSFFFPLFHRPPNVVRLSFLFFPFRFVQMWRGRRRRREDVDITFRYSFLRRVIIVA